MRRKHYRIRAGEHTLPLGPRTYLMGIVNMTPDSFSQDGCYVPNSERQTIIKALKRADRLIKNGADILDIGGESTRPGAARISAKEEIRRIMPTIEHLAKHTSVPVSVDTYKPEVAQRALDAGAVIVNNIMGTRLNKTLVKMIARYGAAVVLMHIKGTPRTMQKNVRYRALIPQIVENLQKSIEFCLENGLKKDRIIVDPGIGFGKTAEHNLEILNSLKSFNCLKQPILIGASRKSFIGHVLGADVAKRLTGSVACACAGIMNGAHIARVHDVKETKEAVTIIDAVMNAKT